MKPSSTPPSSAKRSGRNRPLLFFVVLAMLVVFGGYWYQQRHATTIEETPTHAEADSLKAKNLAAGEAFLAAKAQETGVQTLGAGLLYKVLKSGDVWEVYVPHYMAYGEAGSGSNIPPCSALVFKIELLEVK